MLLFEESDIPLTWEMPGVILFCCSALRIAEEKLTFCDEIFLELKLELGLFSENASSSLGILIGFNLSLGLPARMNFAEINFRLNFSPYEPVAWSASLIVFKRFALVFFILIFFIILSLSIASLLMRFVTWEMLCSG